jgi:hypothetical protein
MSDIVYRSRASVTRIDGPIRHAKLPACDEPVTFGVHDEIAAHYKIDPERYAPHAATLDYIVAATCG